MTRECATCRWFTVVNHPVGWCDHISKNVRGQHHEHDRCPHWRLPPDSAAPLLPDVVEVANMPPGTVVMIEPSGRTTVIRNLKEPT